MFALFSYYRCSQKFDAAALLFGVLTTLAACSGGGGDSSPSVSVSPASPPISNDPPVPAFGLQMRESLATLPFSAAPAAIENVELFNAFPAHTFTNPVFLTAIPGSNDLAVVEQSGRILRFDASGSGDLTVMLDISARQPMQANEEGLLGLAFDPNFESSGRAYVHYTDHSPRRSVLSRVQRSSANPLLLDESTEQVLLEANQPFSNHNGGMLAYGPDGMLYMALGDGGAANDPQNNSQRLSNLLGKLLRLDTAGAGVRIPADNPFVNQAGARGEIWAYGLRNPWRFSFDRLSGDLWVGDVGQNSREEINIVTRGSNYGWRVFEAEERFDDSLNSLPDSAFTPPVFSYGRDSGFSVTGGYVYRGSAAPSLQGRYVYADFGGEIWALEYDGSTPGNNRSLGIVNSVSSFGEDAEGELYALALGGSIFAFRQSEGGGASAAPQLLSNSGLFTDLGNLSPSAGMIEYDVNTAFWSDGASKRRWIGVPTDTQIVFNETGVWQFPVGSVVVKHFEYLREEGVPESSERLETRVLVNTENGFQGFVYRWNEAQTDAQLLTGSEQETLQISTASGTQSQVWHYPSRAECLACHTSAAGEVLGVNTRQINRDFSFSDTSITDNQLRSWNNIALFSTDINSDMGSAQDLPSMVSASDTSQTIEARARAYLDTNCAQCHRPGGAAGSTLDLRYSIANSAMNAIGVQAQSAPELLITPGAKEGSMVWQRMATLEENRMPPLASNRIDENGVALIGEWIDSL